MKKKKSKAEKIGDVISWIILIPTLVLAVWIMANGLGLADSLDFGAGAYFYADMPNFQKYTDVAHYTTDIPMWVYIALFLGWGALMYRLWVFIDRKS